MNRLGNELIQGIYKNYLSTKSVRRARHISPYCTIEKTEMANVTPFCVFCQKSTLKLKKFSVESLCKYNEI